MGFCTQTHTHTDSHIQNLKNIIEIPCARGIMRVWALTGNCILCLHYFDMATDTLFILLMRKGA